MGEDRSDIINEKMRLLRQAKTAAVFNEVVRSAHSRLHELARIDAALDRLDDGTFGQCLSCKLDIDLEALKEDPSQSYCRECMGIMNVDG